MVDPGRHPVKGLSRPAQPGSPVSALPGTSACSPKRISRSMTKHGIPNRLSQARAPRGRFSYASEPASTWSS